MSFRYEENTINYYLKMAEHMAALIRTNNVGTRDSHQQEINRQLIHLCVFLADRLACVTDNVYLPEGVDPK